MEKSLTLIKFPDIDHRDACLETVLKSLKDKDGDFFIEVILESIAVLYEESEYIEHAHIERHLSEALLWLRHLKKFSNE